MIWYLISVEMNDRSVMFDIERKKKGLKNRMKPAYCISDE